MLNLNGWSRGRRSSFALAASSAILLLLIFGFGRAQAATEWTTESIWAPTPLQAGASGILLLELGNKGSTSASGPAQVKIDLPAGATYDGRFEGFATCSGTTTVTCLNVSHPLPFGRRDYRIGYNVAPGTGGTSSPYTVTVEGGGAASNSVETGQLDIADQIFGFGFKPGTLVAGMLDQAGVEDTQAGGHPYKAIGAFDVNLDNAGFSAEGMPKDILTDLPVGFIGDPTAVATCPREVFEHGDCPPESQIGIIRALVPLQENSQVKGIFNIEPPSHLPAQFGFHISQFEIFANPVVRADGNYAIQLKVPSLPEGDTAYRNRVEIWGVPADPSHDSQRCRELNLMTMSCNGLNSGGSPIPTSGAPSSSSLPPKAFLSQPTECAEADQTIFRLSLWNNPAPEDDLEDPRWRTDKVDNPPLIGCDEIPFDPTLALQPTTKQADSPSGLDVHLHVPREDDDEPGSLVQSHLKKATATLPEGLAFNAGIADGLEACTPAQIGLKSAPGEEPIRFNNVEPSCPSASKIGSGEVISPLLEEHLRGEVFLASQKANPFNSNYAIYVVVREPSILVKIPGKVEADPVTGQVKVTFDENPQLPFSDFIMHFYDGPRAALATPVTCGTFASSTDLDPWSAQDPDNPTAAEAETIVDPFTIDSSPSGACVSNKAQLPLNVGLTAGSADPIAGARSPFRIQITRPDANQELDKLDISPPPGFVGSLRGIPYCSEAQIASATTRDSGKEEQSSPSCPVASQLGTTNVGAGAGPAPYYAPGKLYLAGPYKGAKLSVVAITPAVAGPFDLGNVVVRSKLEIDPLTARITASTDSLPKTIEGVPLRIRDIRIDLDRPNWAMNPTNCEAMSVDVTAYGIGGAIAKPSNRYQLSGCEKLGFKPKLSIRFKGGTKRGDHPALLATLSTRDGDANIARAAVTLPRASFLDQAHIRTICTRVQFAADACPPGATYGTAEATTELLDEPLKGNVILRSSNNKLPDLVGNLQGVADIEAVGRIDSIKGGIRNTFEVVPDAPFDVFTLRMQGGKKGLVINSQSLCAKTHRATVKLTAHNGRTYNFRPKVVATGCAKAKKSKRNRRG